MEELLTLKDLLLKGDISGALTVVEELEEMSRDDKINNITSYAVILLIHLIKQEAENRTTKSWEISIRNSVLAIQRKNKRRQFGGYYLNYDELQLAFTEAYEEAINKASLEVAKGKYEPTELSAIVDRKKIIDRARKLISG
ncbi:MAG: DUF29 family protein [Oscillatoria sp. PMC 1068.18]|nr:DUF29 family protein [Oscillatoria sp. PMC 1076.18]MEC4989803.1 DUF29 family protein [Oscillatoria sp. PMC 1068.18]